MKKFWLIFIFILFISIFLIPSHAAQAGIFDKNVAEECSKYGDCTVCDALAIMYGVGKFIFGSMAGIAMIWLLWAAVGMIFNWGNAEAMAGAKKTILHTFLAILFIMAAYALVNILITIYLQANFSEWDDRSWTRKWAEGPICEKQTSSFFESTGGGGGAGGGRPAIPDGNCWTILTSGIYTGKAGQPFSQCDDASTALKAALLCIKEKVAYRGSMEDERWKDFTLVITSISDNAGFKTCQGSSWTDDGCFHMKNSCHYGGSAQLNKSYAADLRSWVSGQNYKPAHFDALEAIQGDCGFTLLNGEYNIGDNSHYHISVPPCSGG